MLQRIAATMTVVVSQALTLASAQAQQSDSAQIAELRKQVDALSREIEAMKLGEDVVVLADTSSHALGPAASKIYRTKQGLSIGGYGEFLMQRSLEEQKVIANEGGAAGEAAEEAGGENTIDALRAIVYVGYKFTPRFLFNSEIEFEHASTEYGGAVGVEFAYLDFIASPKFGVRAGMLLVPMGLINELHEPPVFLGTHRPLTETAIIPSTWRENGVGVFGELKGLSYRAYLINSFDAIGGRFAEAEGFSAGGLRGGRQSGSEALFESPALVARLDYNVPGALGATIGGSAYFGNSVQSEIVLTGNNAVKGGTSILEGHAQYRAGGFDLRALVATAHVNDAAQLNQLHSFTGEQSIGSRLTGWYLQGGYDLLRGSTQQLVPYVRFEKVNTQASVPAGFRASAQNNQRVTTLGAMWKPITNISLKADLQATSNEAAAKHNQLNVSLGYLF